MMRIKKEDQKMEVRYTTKILMQAANTGNLHSVLGPENLEESRLDVTTTTLTNYEFKKDWNVLKLPRDPKELHHNAQMTTMSLN